jgi:2-keto-4-pentenoate hydratase/2-oxohepta-3-ene-1,7-dioic acid hydratase in catechol pathway
VRIRRQITSIGPETSVIEAETAQGWTALAGDELAWLTELPPPSPVAGFVLPFQPRSFRDVLLYQDHWINSSRGYVRRFMPSAFRVTSAYERLTGTTFPAFRPPQLFHTQPVYYFGNHLTIVPSGVPVAIPSFTQALDYELELGFVLAKPLRNATAQEAIEAIGGFVVINDFSARDIQRDEMRSGFGPQKSKHFLSSMSATLVTPEDILPRIEALEAAIEINGRRIASLSSAGMRFSLGEVLAYLSKDEQLHPGELIATGTLPGGSGLETRRLLAKSDELRLIIEGVGEITHTIQ